MKNINGNMNPLLMQLKLYAKLASGAEENISKIFETKKSENFDSIFKKTLNSVNDQQNEYLNLMDRYNQGDSNVGLPSIMIASEKANISFQALVKVRNSFIESYEEIMKMPI